MEESLYYAEIKLLTKYCQHCLDNKTKQRLMMFLFKKTLWENALALGYEEDADQYYKEMLRLLNVANCNDKPIDNCEYGYCALC